MASLLARSSRDLRLMRLERTPRYSGSRACRTTRMKRRGRPVQANLNANYFYNIDNSQIAANLVSFFNPRNAGPGRGGGTGCNCATRGPTGSRHRAVALSIDSGEQTGNSLPTRDNRLLREISDSSTLCF
jgi:hypothetical protein